MNYDQVRQYAQERGANADERYLIESIEENTTDPATRELIEFWFAQYEED